MDVRWQLSIAKQQVTAGARVPIIDKWMGTQGVHLKLGGGEHASTFLLRHIVNIGGRNYLLIQDESQDDLIMVRVQSTDAVSAIDADRLSSLRNALEYFFESDAVLKIEDVESVLGARLETQRD